MNKKILFCTMLAAFSAYGATEKSLKCIKGALAYKLILENHGRDAQVIYEQERERLKKLNDKLELCYRHTKSHDSHEVIILNSNEEHEKLFPKDLPWENECYHDTTPDENVGFIFVKFLSTKEVVLRFKGKRPLWPTDGPLNFKRGWSF